MAIAVALLSPACHPRSDGVGLSQQILDARKPNGTPPQFLRPPVEDRAPSSPNATLIIFIHGIFGDTVGTWKGSHGSLVDLVLDRPEFAGQFDAFAFGFQSSMLKPGSFKIPEAAKALESEIRFRHIPEKYKRFVIVAHSMGGLVALEALTTFPTLRERVPLVVTFATPYEGAQVAKLGKDLIDNPALESMLPLDGSNSFLTSLGNRWKQTKVGNGPQTNVVCAYETVSFPGIGMIVPETSGTRLCDGIADAIGDDHIGIIKPDSAEHQSIKVLTNALRTVTPLVDTPLPALFEPLEYVDGDYQERSMKACPKGFAIAGMNVAENKVLCRRVLAPKDADVVTSIVDASNQRVGVHACPSGMYARGYNDERNQLLCSQDSRFTGSPKDEFQDGPPASAATTGYGMHVCPAVRPGAVTVMTGINAGQNRFLCANISLK